MKIKRGFLIAVVLLWYLPFLLFPILQDEYMVKAVYLEKFAQFTQWPDRSGMADTSKLFVLGVIGKNPFGSILEKVYSAGERKIKKKKVTIKYFSSPAEITGCHLLFISKSVKKDLPKILSITKNKPVLTLGETNGFAQKGVHINFYFSGNNIRFEINPLAIREASLSVDSSLLRIGKIVIPSEKTR